MVRKGRIPHSDATREPIKIFDESNGNYAIDLEEEEMPEGDMLDDLEPHPLQQMAERHYADIVSQSTVGNQLLSSESFFGRMAHILLECDESNS